MNEELKLAREECEKALKRYNIANQNYINAMSDCERQSKKEKLRIAIEDFHRAFVKYDNLQKQDNRSAKEVNSHD